MGCMLLGIGLQFVPAFPRNAAKGLNGFLIYVSLPAITLRYLPALQIDWQLLFPVLMAWLVFGLALLVFPLLGRGRGWSSATVGCLVLVCGLGNTSFVGFPLIEAMYGEAGLKLAVLCDQPGSFLVLSTLGILAMGYFLTGRWSLRAIGSEILRFPPFLAFLASLIVLLAGITWPSWLAGPLETLGGTMTPVAMVSIGLQLQKPWRPEAPWEELRWGLLLKLLLAPAIISGLYLGLFQLTGLVAKVSILEAAMGPMITPSIIAIEKNMNPSLASLLVAIGVPLSLLTVYGWQWLLESWLI